MLKAVLFDFDGTLLDTSKAIIEGFKYIIGKYRPDIYTDDDSFYYYFLGPSFKESIPKYFPNQDHELVVNEYRTACLPYMNKEHINLFKDVKDTLKKLKEKGIKLGICTSRILYSTKQMLKEFEILDYFDVIVGFDSGVELKPKPDQLIYAMDKLGVNNTETIYIGDHKHDVKSGVSANVKTYVVEYSMHNKEELLQEGAVNIIHSIAEILDM